MTEDKWQTAFTFSQPFSAGWTLSWETDGALFTKEMKVAPNKVSIIDICMDSGIVTSYKETICVKNGTSGMVYYRESDDESYAQYTDGTLSTYNSYEGSFGDYFSLAKDLKYEFANANPNGNSGVYTVKIASSMLYGYSVTNLRYTVTFEDGILVDVVCEFVMSGGGQSVDHIIDFDFVDVTINVPTPDQILPSQN